MFVKDIDKPIDEKEFKMKIPFHKYYRPNVYLLGHQKRETEFLGSCSLLRQAGQLSSKEKMAKKV